MKTKIIMALLLVALLCGPVLAQNVSNYMEQGGTRWVVGGVLDVVSGGEIDIESGGAFKIGGTAATASAAEFNYLDLVTLGTGAASKAIVLDASGDYTYPATYTGVIPSGGTETFQSGSTFAVAGTLSVDSVTVNKIALSLPGRATVWICGDATTVNNNTVYYGPSRTVAANAGRACDITAVGNVTEATADAPAFDAKAFQVLSWYCLQPDAGADLTYTLRSAAAGLTPAQTITIADNGLDGTNTTGTTTAIASGATLAVAVNSTADVGTAQFACAINVAF